MSSDSYFRCPGCGRFVNWNQADQHYKTDHKEGIATESPPAPATNPNPPPGHPDWNVPPRRNEPKTPSVLLNIALMWRDYKKAFLVYTAIVIALTMLGTTNLFLWVILHAR